VLLFRAVESCRVVEGGRGGIPRDGAGIAPEDFGEASSCSQSAIAGECPPGGL
jgi:hypothetical protein